MAPQARTMWDRCQANVDRWCADQSNGSPRTQIACYRDAEEHFAALPDDAARVPFLTTRGCAQAASR